jgi:glycosyltransferase involved in cell wall biosynthesis
MPAPRFSIVTAAFNAADTIADTIASVLSQSSPAWEMVVVDDGSTDDTRAIAIAAARDDSRIRIVSQPNAGTGPARNAGAALCIGEFLVFLDADDLLEPGYCQNQAAFIDEHSGHDIYSCNAWMLLADGSKRVFWQGRHHQQPFSLRAEDQIAESSILPMTVITRRVLDLTGGFRDLHSEDYDFWLRALLAGATHAYDPAVLAVSRRREGSKTRALVAEAESFLWILEDNAAREGLTESQREAFARAIPRAQARVERRELEERLLGGDFAGARGRYWRSRAAFPDRLKYAVGLAVMALSPAWYARIKSARMI